jgi:uncharacterized membrane protein (GlpM family)
MDIIWKGVIGGLMTAVIVWLSKRGNTLPGILPLFPTFGICYLAIDRLDYRIAILAGIAAWLIAALCIFVATRWT